MAIPKYPPHPRWTDVRFVDTSTAVFVAAERVKTILFQADRTPAKGKPGRKPKAQ
jgi:hypothetical protein